MPISTLSDVLRRDRLPKRAVLVTFLDAIGVPDETRREWMTAWAMLAAQ